MAVEHQFIEGARREQNDTDITYSVDNIAENPGFYIRGIGLMLVADGVAEAAMKGEVIKGALIALGGIATHKFAGLYESFRG